MSVKICIFARKFKVHEMHIFTLNLLLVLISLYSVGCLSEKKRNSSIEYEVEENF